ELRDTFLDAAKQDDFNAILLLLDQIEDINVHRGDGWRALHHAVYHGNIRIVKLLLGLRTIDRNALTLSGSSPLRLALQRQASNIVELLLEAGCSRSTLQAVPVELRKPEPVEDEDETFLMLQKVLMNRPAPPMPTIYSREELLERRRRQRERRRNSLYEGNEREEPPASYVERRIRSRVVSGSFSLAQVDLMSHDRWALEDPMGRLHPIVTRTKKGRERSTLDNPKLQVVFTNEGRVLQESLTRNIIAKNTSAASLLHAPRSTWYIRGKDI
ncbi:hypothetical protein THRCLA_01971, partial [Thraustotheca clavata]